MAKKPPKYGRDVQIKVRQADLNNLNLKPEKHGTALEPRSDLSLTFTLKRDELDALELTQALWTGKGNPVLDHLAGPIALDFIFDGTLKIGPAGRGECDDFENARLKKISVVPRLEWELEVNAQVRIDPEEELSELNRLLCAGKCKFGFVGKMLLAGGDDVDEDAPEQTDIEDQE